MGVKTPGAGGSASASVSLPKGRLAGAREEGVGGGEALGCGVGEREAGALAGAAALGEGEGEGVRQALAEREALAERAPERLSVRSGQLLGRARSARLDVALCGHAAARHCDH